MEKCDIRFNARFIIVIMITLGVLFFAAHSSEGQTGKAYVSTQDGTKMLVFSLTNNSLIKTIPIYTATPLGQALPPNINDVLAVGNRTSDAAKNALTITGANWLPAQSVSSRRAASVVIARL